MTATSVPKTLIAGDTWQFTLSFADYLAPTWTAAIYFQNAADAKSATASASSSDHAFTISAIDSATYKPGRYKWSVRVTSGSSSFTVGSGWIDIDADPGSTGSRDLRSWARRALEAVEATLEGRANDAQQSMSIKDRSLSHYSLKELQELHTWLKSKVGTEELGADAGKGRRIGARFSRG
jgi:hypothetical protein